MRSLLIVVIVGMLLFPSVIVVSPEVDIRHGKDTSNISNTRSGPQTYQDDLGGWWLQEEEEDFEGGVFEDMEIVGNKIQLIRKALPLNQWEWRGVDADSSPGPRHHHAMAYDKSNKKVVLFGGYYYDGGQVHYLSDTWLLDMDTMEWSQGASGPEARFSHSMVFDEYNDRIILFGGWRSAGGNWKYHGDTWFYDTQNNSWDLISNGGPSPRRDHAMAYDNNKQLVVMYGGSPETGSCGKETWIFNCREKAWFKTVDGPVWSDDHDIAYDKNMKKTVLYAYNDGTFLFDTNTYTWIEKENVASFGRNEHYSAVYDDISKRTIIYGGYDTNEYLSETWAFDSSGWVGATAGPAGRKGHDMVFDSQARKTILFGGMGDGNPYLSDTWTLTTSKISPIGTYTSGAIDLPSGQVWDNLLINVSESNDTELTVSIMDGDTGLYIPEYRDMEPRHIDLCGLTATSIKLRCNLESDGENTPCLDSWKVTWKKKIPKPEYLGGIPSNIPVTEDTPEAAILDLSQYFGETRSSDFTYQIESISDDVNINVEINDSYLDVTYFEDNWTGKTDLVVNCTNDYGESVSSDKFSIVVQRVDDAPAWSSKPTIISIDEDDSHSSASSYMDYLIDAEGDMLTLDAVCDVTNVTVQMSPEGYLTVIPEKDYFGTGVITITASEIYNPSLKAVTTIPIIVNAVNDDPAVELRTPGDGAVYNDTNISLSWQAYDIDTPNENITFGLYFGETKTPSLYMSDVTENSIDLADLVDKTTYYWYVEADDGDRGKTVSPTWSFSIDTESEVIPGDTDTDTGGLNVTIYVNGTNIIVEQGNDTSFDIEVKNDGDTPVALTIVTAGDTSPCLSLNNFITLSAQETKKETVKVTRTALLEPGNYTISLVFISPDGMKYVSVPLWIKEGKSNDGTTVGNGGKKPGGDTEETTVVEEGIDNFWLYLVIGLLFLFIIFLTVTSSITNSKLKKRREDFEKREEKEKLLEGEAYIPRKTPFEPQIEDPVQIPGSPGPYQPQQQLPGQPFGPRLSTFQSAQSVIPQLPTSQSTPLQETPAVPSVSTQPLTDADITAILGTSAATTDQGVTTPQAHESFQTPIPPLVQLPQTGGPVPQQEQKMLPENTTGAPPPPEA